MSFDLAHPRLLIDGKWTDTPHRTTVANPWDGSSIAEVPLADEAVLDEAIGAAHRAFERVRSTPAHRRAEVLLAAAKIIERRRSEFADVIVAEAGKPIALADAEVVRCVVTLTAAADECRRAPGELLAADAYSTGEGYLALTRRFPVGVVYGMTPFNFPLNLVAHKVAPAVASNNTIVVKPSPRTPLSALMLADALTEAGAPAGQVNVVACPNELAERPCRDARVRHVSFTGSVPVGWQIRQAAGKKKVTLELGGNAGLIVHSDASLPDAVRAAATGGFGYAGQSCISVQRAFVHERLYDRFRAELLAHVTEKVRCGDPRRRDVLVGPMIDRAALQRALDTLADATRAGARILCGGETEGPCLQPTVVENADPALQVASEEVFAPVIVLDRYAEFDDALRRVNSSRFGLQAGLFTNDLSLALRAFEMLEVGGVLVNQVPTFRLENQPYGGVKDSGLGREGLRYAMEEMTELRALIVKR